MLRIRVLSVVFWIVVAGIGGSAQAVYGNIDGTVTDSTGAAVPNARVTITDAERGLTYNATTNADGNYTQTHLLAGHYALSFTAPGFSATTSSADVQVNATTRLDATLKVGAANTEVTVTGETPLLQTDRAEISTSLTGQEVAKLPILDRNITQLVLQVPGAQLNSWQHASSENPEQGLQINVNGQFFTANGFSFDGTENQSAILGIAVINPNIDSLQDFKVSTSNYDAEFGSASGAVLQATTKSGTNNFHGSLFEYLRNNKLNAAIPCVNCGGPNVNPPIRWNQFGGSLGGAIIKDRLFFFYDYQGTRRRTGGSLQTTVPTASERAGDLSGLLGNYICSYTDAKGNAHGETSTSSTVCDQTNGPFVLVTVTTTEGQVVTAQDGMVFSPSQLDATGNREAISTGGQLNLVPVSSQTAALFNFLPQPNTSVGGAAFNYLATGSEKFDTDQHDARIDYAYSEATHFFGRYTIADFTKNDPAAFGDVAGGPAFFGFAGQSLDRNQSLALGMDHTFTPTLLTDARLAGYRYRIRVQPNGVGTTPALDAGIPGLNLGDTATSGMPAFYINGTNGFNFGYALGVNQCNCPLKQTENHFQLTNNWTKISGNHNLKFGGDLRRAQQQRIPSDSHRSGELTFVNAGSGSPAVDTAAAGAASTGQGLASFMLGDVSFFGRYFSGNGYTPGIRQTRLFFYGQDQWRITPKLTFNYGLRWENYLPQTAAHPGGAGTFDPATAEVLAAGVGSVPSNMGVKTYNLGFAPRLGVAYEIVPRTVVRAGYGRSFNPSGLGAIFGQGTDYNPPITIPQSLGTDGYTAAFTLAQGPGLPPAIQVGSNGRFPLPNGISVFYFFAPPDSYRFPEADFWNLTLQHEFSPTFTAQAAYVGNVGRHIYVAPNLNQATPGGVIGDQAGFLSRLPFYPKFGLTQGLYQTCNCDNSSYNGLQTQLQKRASHGLDFVLTYTWSKAMDNSEGSGGFADNYNIRADHGPASFDRAHVVTLTGNWDLPIGKNTTGWVNQAIGGWRFSSLGTLESGAPFNITSNAPLLNSNFNYTRPDIIGNPVVSNPTDVLWFNPAAYVDPQQPYRNGTTSRDSLRGPALYLFDIALAKTFTVAEGKTVELRWENFNAFNHLNLGQPNSYIDGSNVGMIQYAATDPRRMQLGLHFRF